METNESIKTIVREKYASIVTETAGAGGCGCGCGTAEDLSLVGDAYTTVDGYVKEADFGLGCGVPTELANIKQGQTVLDLGSGAGLDVFTARAAVGETGRVIGVDMTPEMIAKAQENAKKLGFENVEFILGDIESLPIESNSVDVVISNCVLNLVPDKAKAFSELYRVLKPGGHFCVSDIVVKGALPQAVQEAAELYVGCVSGAIELGRYMQIIDDTGFEAGAILKSNQITVPRDILEDNLDQADVQAFYQSGSQVLSVTANAVKPS